MQVLKVSGLTKRFGGLIAVDNLSFDVEENEIVGLIGPNGAGKTTVFNMISGLLKADAGKIEFYGKNITNISPHAICKLGVGRTFQLVRTFERMSAIENVMVGICFGCASTSNPYDSAVELLSLVGLKEKRDVLARDLTLQEKKKVELARALGSNPKLLLLDEVMAGLNPVEIDGFLQLLREVRKRLGLTICMVEHVMKAVMSISDRVIVLDKGRKIAEGSPKEVTNDERVIEVYLGEKL